MTCEIRNAALTRKERKMTDITASNTDWTELQQAEDMAYFRADLCLYSPESYTLDEKREICEQMESASKAIEDAIKADFEALPPEAQDKLLDMLCASGCMTPEWWKETLFGKMPDWAPME